MIISFDLDDTLIPSTKHFDTEQQNLLQRVFGIEKIRLGSIKLIKALQQQGHKVFIYTTSYRSKNSIWWTFFTYGIAPDKIINQETHNNTLKEKAKNYSKFPPAFSIDIHVDDSEGVEIEGSRYNFKTILVAANNQEWTEYIRQILKT
ncbi:MAG: hypothetical protein QM726_11185 [Chitinophagaceae bacterium]